MAATIVGLALPLLLTRCRDATQIRFVVTTDLPCPVNGTAVYVGSLATYEGRPPTATSLTCQAGYLGSFVVIPSGDDSEEIAVRVVVGSGKSPEQCVADGFQGGCIVARRALRFVPHTSLEVPLNLQATCRDVPCNPTTTCKDGACVPIETVCSGGRCDLPPTDGGSDARAEAGNDGGDGGDGGTNACKGTAGPAMVDVGGYCIDSTEVTRGQYAAFLSSGPSLANQPAECSWNGSYVPNGLDLSTNPSLPVGMVDWCDARAFCLWAGKRLCGAIGGGPLPWGTSTDANKSQWYRACSKAGSQVYPYAAVNYDPTACNGYSDAGAVAPVGSFAKCVGGYPGIFDMSGNVAEWQDSCASTTGANDTCRQQAGAFSYSDPASSSTQCGFLDYDYRDYTNVAVGFRCCSP